MQGQKGFWGFEQRLKELSREGDPLEKLPGRPNAAIKRAGLFGDEWPDHGRHHPAFSRSEVPVSVLSILVPTSLARRRKSSGTR